jgi:hypothetical protein
MVVMRRDRKVAAVAAWPGNDAFTVVVLLNWNVQLNNSSTSYMYWSLHCTGSGPICTHGLPAWGKFGAVSCNVTVDLNVWRCCGPGCADAIPKKKAIMYSGNSAKG